MTPLTRRGLAARWTTPAGRSLAEEVLARLLSGRNLADLGLGHHEGMTDVRGLPAPPPRTLERFEALGWFVETLGDLVQFSGVEVANVDLTGAQLSSFRFFNTKIIRCRFDGANCRDWRLWGTDIEDCSFVKADLRGAAVGTWHEQRRNRWRRVDFTSADFRVGVSWAAVFEDCHFSGAKLRGTQFGQCALIRCRFAGDLRDVLFDGRDLPDRPAPPELEAVDFAEAKFHDVEFKGFDLRNVTLPNDPDVRLVRRARCVARRGLDLLGDDRRLEARMLRGQFENRLRGPGTDEEADVFNRRDYLNSGGAELLKLAEDVIRRAEADCVQ